MFIVKTLPIHLSTTLKELVGPGKFNKILAANTTVASLWTAITLAELLPLVGSIHSLLSCKRASTLIGCHI